jgi:hypothetical protein
MHLRIVAVGAPLVTRFGNPFPDSNISRQTRSSNSMARQQAGLKELARTVAYPSDPISKRRQTVINPMFHLLADDLTTAGLLLIVPRPICEIPT